MPSMFVWDNSNDERDVESIIAFVNILTSNISKRDTVERRRR